MDFDIIINSYQYIPKLKQFFLKFLYKLDMYLQENHQKNKNIYEKLKKIDILN